MLSKTRDRAASHMFPGEQISGEAWAHADGTRFMVYVTNFGVRAIRDQIGTKIDQFTPWTEISSVDVVGGGVVKSRAHAMRFETFRGGVTYHLVDSGPGVQQMLNAARWYVAQNGFLSR